MPSHACTKAARFGEDTSVAAITCIRFENKRADRFDLVPGERAGVGSFPQNTRLYYRIRFIPSPLGRIVLFSRVQLSSVRGGGAASGRFGDLSQYVLALPGVILCGLSPSRLAGGSVICSRRINSKDSEL